MKKITLLLFLMLTFFGFSQNGGDTCATAVTANLGDYTGTTITADSGGSVAQVNGDAAWFVYTATEDGFIEASACASQFVDTQLYVYSGSDCNNLNLIASGSYECILAASAVFPVENGLDYYIEWVYTNTAAPFDWSLSTIACPPPILETFTSVTNITLSEATLSWQGVGSPMLWDIELLDFTAGETIQGLGTIFSDINTPTYTFTNLNEDHQYRAFVRTNCGVGDLSDWSGPAIFTTLTTCPKPDGSISTVTDTTVLVEWTPGDAEDMWEVEVVNLTAGETQGTGVVTLRNHFYICNNRKFNARNVLYRLCKGRLWSRRL